MYLDETILEFVSLGSAGPAGEQPEAKAWRRRSPDYEFAAGVHADRTADGHGGYRHSCCVAVAGFDSGQKPRAGDSMFDDSLHGWE
jgi:hypothetical protein